MDTSHNWPAMRVAAIKEMTFEDLSPEAKGDGVFTIDQSGRLILCNEVCVSYLGYGSAQEILGCHAILFLPVSDEDPISQHPLLSCARGEIDATQMEGVFLRADGSRMTVRYQIERIWLEWGRSGAVCTFGAIEG